MQPVTRREGKPTVDRIAGPTDDPGLGADGLVLVVVVDHDQNNGYER
jgi:hypothetical protein